MNIFKWIKDSMSEETMYYCDGCGEDYPRTHLVYQHQFDGKFCDRCYTPEEGEE